VIAALLLGLAALTAISSGCSQEPKNEVWIVGLDGADWDILDPLLARGDLPNLAKLRREGAWGVLQSDEPMLSPILWTSIATGKTADLHGVTWFMSDGPDGTKIPVSSQSRRVRSVWNIASENDMKVGVLGWWATWPAEPVNGYIVSDYVAWHSFGVTGRDLQVGGKVYPPELIEDVESAFLSSADIEEALLQRMIHLPPEHLRFDPAADPYSDPVMHLRQALATSRSYTDFALKKLAEERPELLAVYYEGTDAIMHLFMNYAPPRLPWIDAQEFAAYRDVVGEYWRWQDEVLGELLAQRGPNTSIVVVSDHGFRTGNERLKEDHFSVDTADASHMPDGIVILNGPGIRAGARIVDLDLYDVAPTVLYMLGLPVADDFTGDVASAAFTEEQMQARPVERVSTYEVGEWDRGTDLVVDPAAGQQMEEMLRSLGYISSSGGETGEAAPVSGNVEQAINLSIVLRQQGRYDEAAKTLEDVLEEAPGHIQARTNLARIYAETGRLEEAETLYRALVRDDSQQLEHYEDLALAVANQDDAEGALEVYEAGLAIDPEWVTGLAGKGFALHKLGRSEESLQTLDAALAKDPRHADAHYYRGAVLESLGRTPEAIGELERALSLDPSQVPAAIQLGIIRERQGEIQAALTTLEVAERYAEDDPQLHATLGSILLRVGRVPEALARLEAAVERMPDDVGLRGNYGLALLMSGDLPRAAENFEAVTKLDPQAADAFGQLGGIYMQMGRPDDAERVLTRAVEMQPDHAQLQFSLGGLYHRTGRLDQAKAQYEKAIELDDDVGVYHYMLGMVYGEQGNEVRAMELVNEGRRLDPTLPMPGEGPPPQGQ
jgi:tetratricopeptide (TPR) repeat protein